MSHVAPPFSKRRRKTCWNKTQQKSSHFPSQRQEQRELARVGSAPRPLPIHWDELEHIRGAGPSPGRPVSAGTDEDRRPSLLAEPWGQKTIDRVDELRMFPRLRWTPASRTTHPDGTGRDGTAPQGMSPGRCPVGARSAYRMWGMPTPPCRIL